MWLAAFTLKVAVAKIQIVAMAAVMILFDRNIVLSYPPFSIDIALYKGDYVGMDIHIFILNDYSREIKRQSC